MSLYQTHIPYMYIAFVREDSELVARISSELRALQFRVCDSVELTACDDMMKRSDDMMGCSCFCLLLSPDSVKSGLIKESALIAIKSGKRICPLIIEGTKLPAEIYEIFENYEMFVIDPDESAENIAKRLAGWLPYDIYSFSKLPFLIYGGYSFFCDAAKTDEDVSIPALRIYSVDKKGNQKALFTMSRSRAYDASYHIASLQPFSDRLYGEKIYGSYQLNIHASFLLEYPLSGPDVDALLICILRIPRNGEPEIRLIDYQYVGSTSTADLTEQEDSNVIGEVGWSAQIKSMLESKLFK